MSDTENDDLSAPGIDNQAQREDSNPDQFRIEVIPDQDAETVTFVPSDPDDDLAKTAWITADAGLVVNVAGMG